jgi:hypothetical protein
MKMRILRGMNRRRGASTCIALLAGALLLLTMVCPVAAYELLWEERVSFDAQDYHTYRIAQILPNGDTIYPPEGHRYFSEDTLLWILFTSAKQAEHPYQTRLYEYSNNPDGVIIESVMGIERQEHEDGESHSYEWVAYNAETPYPATRDPSAKKVHEGDTWHIDYTRFEWDEDGWYFDPDDAVYRVIIHANEN